MEYIAILSFSGSCMMILYYLLRRIGHSNLTKRLEYLLLKACMFYFIVPLPILKLLYQDAINALSPLPIDATSFNSNGKMVLYTKGSFYLNNIFKITLFLFIIWFAIALLILIRSIIQYRRFRKSLLYCSQICADETILNLLDSLRKEYGIKRHISLRLSEEAISPFTLGIFHPVIIMTREDSLYAQSLILKHELIHNKRLDCVVKLITSLMICLHWYNPLAHCLKRKLEIVCEMSCDETVAQNLDMNGCADYANLIVGQLRRNNTRPIFASYFSSPKSNIEERIRNIMKNQTNKKTILAVLMPFFVAIAVFLNTATVFAYEDVAVMEYSGAINDLTVSTLANANVSFIPVESEDLGTSIVESNACFVDEHNQEYDLTNQSTPYIFCNHYYVPGEFRAHNKESGGNCYTLLYQAEMCTKCNRIIIYELIGETRYIKCPH